MFQYQTPLSRQAWVGLDIPFAVHLDGDNGARDETDFGDVTVTPS